MFLCGTGQDGGQGRAVHGVVPGLACGGVAGRTGPAHVNPVISHRHPDICPDETRGRAIPPSRPACSARLLSATIYAGRRSSGRPGDRMQGTTSMPVSRAVGTRSCPGNNGVAPGEQDGTGKTGSPDRRRDLPDLIRRTGSGFQGTGTSGGSRPIPGLRTGPEHVPSREGFFAAGHAGPPDDFFSAGTPQIPARPLRRFPRAFREGHFVSGGGAISFQMTCRKKFPEWLQSVVGGGNPKRNEMQKNRHAEVGKCGT